MVMLVRINIKLDPGLKLECFQLARSQESLTKRMENLMVIRVEVIAPEKPLISKHLQK